MSEPKVETEKIFALGHADEMKYELFRYGVLKETHPLIKCGANGCACDATHFVFWSSIDAGAYICSEHFEKLKVEQEAAFRKVEKEFVERLRNFSFPTFPKFMKKERKS